VLVLLKPQRRKNLPCPLLTKEGIGGGHPEWNFAVAFFSYTDKCKDISGMTIKKFK
jgi:hypothetical protein